MQSWRKAWAGLGALGLTLLVWVAFGCSPEPRFDGITLSEWLGVLNRGSTTPFRAIYDPDAKAVIAMSRMGNKALPCLISWTAYEPRGTGFKHSVGSFLKTAPKLPCSALLGRWISEDTEALRADRAAAAFPYIGEAGKAAVVELEQLANDPASTNGSRRAMFALACLGKEGLPPLLRTLDNKRANNRRVIPILIETHEGLRTSAIPVTAVLVKYLSDPDWCVRAQTAECLVAISRQPDPLLPLMPSRFVLLSAAATVERYSPPTEAIAEGLRTALEDGDVRVRRVVTNAALKVAPEILRKQSSSGPG